MKKRLVSLVLCVILLITFSPVAMAGVNDFPKGNLEAPKNVSITVVPKDNMIDIYKIGLSIPSSITALNDEWAIWSKSNNASNMSINLEYDYKLNENGKWHYTIDWEFPSTVLDTTKLTGVGPTDLVNIDPAKLSDISNKMSMLDTNIVYFRCRFSVTFHDNTNDVDLKTVSPWSDEAAVEKNATAGAVTPPGSAGNAAGFPGKLDAPNNVAVSSSIENGAIYNYTIGFSVPAAYQSLNDRWNAWSTDKNVEEMNVYLEYDYSYNSTTNWHYNASWDMADGALEEWKISDFNENEVAYATASVMRDIPNNESTLTGNTAYFRCRFAVTYYDSDLGTYVKSASAWSNTAAVGKDANAVVMKMDPPVLTKAELKADVDTGAPYFEITNKATEAVKTIDNSGTAIYIQIQYRKNGGQWITITGYNKLQEQFVVIPENTSDNAIDIKAGTYEIRARYGHCTDTAIVDVWSAYSNIIKIGSPAFYKGASKWAEPYLDRAAGYGFITDRVKDNLSGNITREEFAEIALRLYEKYTGIKAEAGSASFTDTSNPEILKAANVGLVSGVGHGKYAPKQLVTREQMTTILLNALKIIKPSEDFSSTGSPKFTDDKDFSGYARASIYYCSKNGIVSGIGNNMFGSKRNSTREAAIIVCTKAYELYMNQ